MSTTYGHQQAKPGDRCTNSPWVTYYTTPCCYADLDSPATECPECGAPIECETENVPITVCTIREDDDK